MEAAVVVTIVFSVCLLLPISAIIPPLFRFAAARPLRFVPRQVLKHKNLLPNFNLRMQVRLIVCQLAGSVPASPPASRSGCRALAISMRDVARAVLGC